MDEDIRQGILFFKCLQPNERYDIYYQNNNIGTLQRVNSREWNLKIPIATINLHGQYRFDLIEESELLYRTLKTIVKI